MKHDLDEVKSGDRLIRWDRSSGFGGNVVRMVVTVEKVTATTIRADGVRYSRGTGREHGTSGFHRPYIEPATRSMLAEIAAEQSRRVLVAKALRVVWEKAPLKLLQAVSDAIDVAKGERQSE